MSLAVLRASYEKVDRRDVEKAKAYRRFIVYDTSNKVLGRFESSDFINIIIAQTRLREISQREDSLREKLQVQRERMTINRQDEKAKAPVHHLEDEITSLRRTWWHQEQKLYQAESLLGWPLKGQYRDIRKDSHWYMVRLLIEDCASRGGCCGRECGCCWKHSEPSRQKKDAGHCTVECKCCIQNRGFELTEKEKDQDRRNFEDMLWSRNPMYALEMALGYFVKRNYVKKHRTVSSAVTGPNVSASNGSVSNGSVSNEATSKEVIFEEAPPPYSAPTDTIKDVSRSGCGSRWRRLFRRDT